LPHYYPIILLLGWFLSIGSPNELFRSDSSSVNHWSVTDQSRSPLHVSGLLVDLLGQAPVRRNYTCLMFVSIHSHATHFFSARIFGHQKPFIFILYASLSKPLQNIRCLAFPRHMAEPKPKSSNSQPSSLSSSTSNQVVEWRGNTYRLQWVEEKPTTIRSAAKSTRLGLVAGVNAFRVSLPFTLSP
jgi:hypothetical protein